MQVCYTCYFCGVAYKTNNATVPLLTGLIVGVLKCKRSYQYMKTERNLFPCHTQDLKTDLEAAKCILLLMTMTEPMVLYLL